VLRRLRVRREMAEHQVKQLRLDLSRGAAVSLDVPELSSRLQFIRHEVDAKEEVEEIDAGDGLVRPGGPRAERLDPQPGQRPPGPTRAGRSGSVRARNDTAQTCRVNTARPTGMVTLFPNRPRRPRPKPKKEEHADQRLPDVGAEGHLAHRAKRRRRGCHRGRRKRSANDAT